MPTIALREDAHDHEAETVDARVTPAPLPAPPAELDRRTIDVVDLPKHAIDDAVDLLARAMRDTPIHVAALGDDPDKREKRLRRLFGTLFRTSATQRPLGARVGDRLVGVTGMTPPHACRPSARQRAALTAAIATFGLRTTQRTVEWLDEWAGRDLTEPHAHLGPFGVIPELQHNGIGSAILAEHVAGLDAAGSVGFLETDDPANVHLYNRFGYEIVDRALVLGVRCFWMRRDPEPLDL